VGGEGGGNAVMHCALLRHLPPYISFQTFRNMHMTRLNLFMSIIRLMLASTTVASVPSFAGITAIACVPAVAGFL
jgi:hypothetical protein